MASSQLPTFIAMIIGVGFSPGPANIYALAMALSHGRRAALAMWAGLLCGFSVALVAMVLLTYWLGFAIRAYVGWVKYIGATYMLYLAWKAFLNGNEHSDRQGDCSFLSGMIVQITNAKMLLLELTVFFTLVLPYSNRLTDLFSTGAWLLIAGPGANLVWLMAGSCLNDWFDKYKKCANQVTAAFMVACAICILVC